MSDLASAAEAYGPSWSLEASDRFKMEQRHAEESICPKFKDKQSLLSSVTLKSLQSVAVSSDALCIPICSQTNSKSIHRRYYY